MKGKKRMVLGILMALLLAGTVVQAAEPIRVGAILAVTGPASFLGGPEARTLEMLAEEVNAKGGINGHKVELFIMDSGASPEKAVSFAKQLIEEKKVLAILGPSTSGETMQIKGIAEGGKTILLSCAAAEVIVNPVAKWVFKTPQKDSDAIQAIFNQMKRMKISKIGVLSGNDGFGSAGKGQIEKLAPENGITIVANEVYDKASTDLTAEVTKLKAANVEAIVNWSIVPAQSIVIKNARQIGFAGPIFQSHGFGNIKYVAAAGAAAEGVIFPAGRLLVAEVLPDSNPQKAVLMKYKNDYEKKYKEDASTFGGHGYDAFMILAKAIEKAGSTDKEKVRDAIETMRGFIGTGGVFNFSAQDHNGLGIDAFELLTVKDGKFALYGK
ncbi:MAG: branched-chain amino acid ABC transporter substrate-binding protein [Deltaproteobacteria bacterium GWC2_65_14]|nr:MAG: branched-chain amino acid ABC transporter substrate-binding protein [Deltaproteobacteria bacterium GWC2_65_14]